MVVLPLPSIEMFAWMQMGTHICATGGHGCLHLHSCTCTCHVQCTNTTRYSCKRVEFGAIDTLESHVAQVQLSVCDNYEPKWSFYLPYKKRSQSNQKDQKLVCYLVFMNNNDQFRKSYVVPMRFQRSSPNYLISNLII